MYQLNLESSQSGTQVKTKEFPKKPDPTSQVDNKTPNLYTRRGTNLSILLNVYLTQIPVL